jgi:GT2 family glycosyltransferase
VAGNRWNDLERPAADAGADASVSVVIPHYRSEAKLAVTLVGLAGQHHPIDQIEVIVVDDGSDPPLAIDSPPIPVTVLHQPRDGFGAGRARNLGARHASHDIVLFLDADMVPDPGWVRAHAGWHAAYRDLLTVGFRTHADLDGLPVADGGRIVELLGDRPTQVPEWIEKHMERTEELTSEDDDLFRVVTAGNFGISKALFGRIGGFDERFTSWGAEDTELGYRAFTAGAVLVPVRDAHCWHQGLAGGTPDDHEAKSLEIQRARAGHLIAHHGFRRTVAGRSYEVPRLAVLVSASGDAEAVLETIERVLASRWHDLSVSIDWAGGLDDGEWLAAQFGMDPRVRAFAHPATPMHLELSAPATLREDSIGLLLERAAGHGTAEVVGDGKTLARFFTTRARSRAQAISHDDWFSRAGQLFSKTVVDGRDLGFGAATGAQTAGPVLRKFQQGSTLDKLWRRVKIVRSPSEAAKVVRWLAAAVRYRVTGRTSLPSVRRSLGPSAVIPTSDRPLGVEIGTSGESAAGLLGASRRVAPVSVDRRVDLEVHDGPPAGDDHSLPRVWLSGQGAVPLVARVPAFDAEATNPIGWPAEPEGPPVVVPGRGTAWDALESALRPLTPRPIVTVERGRDVPVRPAGLEVVDDVFARARLAPRVLDLPELHRSAPARAAHIAQLAASGAVVGAIDIGDDVAAMLGPDLAAAVLSGSGDLDATAREAVSVRQRRAALRDHSLGARVRQLVAHADLAPIEVPPVSVLAATNRPDYLPHLLAAVSAQNYPRLELVLALHGGGFGGEVEALIRDVSVPVQVVRVAHEMTLGDALNLAVSASSGTLLTKFDDDDHYGADHVWDLVLAKEYSRAQLVGKAAEFVYLAETDATVRRFAGRAESFTTTIGGGALLIARHDLDEAGGWRRVPRQVDRALVEDVERAGGIIYRTHGFGYVLVRHGQGHTWVEGDQYFLDQADAQQPGLALEWAGVTPG